MKLMKNSILPSLRATEKAEAASEAWWEAISKNGLLRHFVPRNDNISAIS